MKSLFNFVFILVLNSFSYGVIIWAYLKINKKLKQNANNAHNIRNSKAIEIQKAVSRILALQVN
jgi:cbb3-type cytochrome oxidase subunit 3